jgi:hypothetical protein
MDDAGFRNCSAADVLLYRSWRDGNTTVQLTTPSDR